MNIRIDTLSGFNLNVSGDGNNVVFGGSGTTFTITKEEKTGGKGAGRGDDSAASKSSESDVLDPEVQKIMSEQKLYCLSGRGVFS